MKQYHQPHLPVHGQPSRDMQLDPLGLDFNPPHKRNKSKKRKTKYPKAALQPEPIPVPPDGGGITSKTFENKDEIRRGEREASEVEATYKLICTESGEEVSLNLLYDLLSSDDYDVFRSIRECPSCAAHATGQDFRARTDDNGEITSVTNQGTNDFLTWDEASHKQRELNPYVWLNTESNNFDGNDNDIEDRVDFSNDLFDDYYFDTDENTLLDHNFVLRARLRNTSTRLRDNPDWRRMLIQVKELGEIGPTGLKQAYKEDIRLSNDDDFQNNVSDTRVNNLLDNVSSGLVRWPITLSEQNGTNSIPERSIWPIKSLYQNLLEQNALESSENVLDISPKSYVRSYRSRNHLSEAPTEKMNELSLQGDDHLRDINSNLKANSELDTTDSKATWKTIRTKLNTLFSYDALIANVNNVLEGLDIQERLNDTTIINYLFGTAPFHRWEDVEITKVVVDEQKKLVSDLVDYLLNLPWETVSTLFNNVVDEITWSSNLYKIEAGASAVQGIWFDRAREFYVPESHRTTTEDFIINTFDMAAMFTPDAWGNLPMSKRTNQVMPDAEKLYHLTLVNEVQIELDQSVPFQKAIMDAKANLDRALPSEQKDAVAMYKGAQFIWETYQQSISNIAQNRGDYVIEKLQEAIANAPEELQQQFGCTDFKWVKATESKGEAAISKLPK